MNDETRAELEQILIQFHNDLLAEHQEATVPDAERVERAAMALFEEDARGFEDDASLPWDLVKRRWLRMARAALAAAGPEADWLDAGLSGLPKRAWLNVQCNEAGCVAMIQMPRRSGARFISGTGPTRTSAIKDAIATALAAKQEGGER